MLLFRPLRLWSFLGGVALTLLACFTAVAALPHDPYIRYQAMAGTIFERVRWIYERIHFDDTPIDIVFIGSSRTARGVNSPVLEESLSRNGLDMNIVNFSLPASGLDIRLTLAREALETRDVDVLVISVVEQFPRDGHQAFADIATISDILNSPWIVNRNLPTNLARLPIRQIQLATKSLIPEAFGYQAEFKAENYAGTSIDPRIFNPGKPSRLKTAADITELEQDSNFRRRRLTRPVLPAALGGIEFGVPRTYIREIADLAKTSGTKLVFLYLPFYGGYAEPFEKQWLEQFGPVLSADFLRTNPQNYNDVAHVSEQGAKRVDIWLTDQLTTFLEQDKHDPEMQ